MRRKLLTLLVLLAAVAAVIIAEKRAHQELDHRFRESVTAHYPGVRLDRSDVRGQPYLLSRAKHTISTAYAYLSPEPDGARRVLLVQNLNLRDGKAQRVRAFITIPYPSTRSKPLLETTANRSQAVLDGELVTYRARVADGILSVETEEHGTDPRFAPEPVSVAALFGTADAGSSDHAPAIGAPELTRVVAIENGILVEFTEQAVELDPGHRTAAVPTPDGGSATVD